MSSEGRDSAYIHKQKTSQGLMRELRKRNTRPVDYKEVDVVSSGSESEGTIIESESGIDSIKLEPGLGDQELDGDKLVDNWTTGTLRKTAMKGTSQIVKLSEANRELEMAREAEIVY